MRKFKKYIALGLAGIMLLGNGAVAGAESGDGEEKKLLEGEELTIWMPAVLNEADAHFEDNIAWQKIQENLGVKLNFIVPIASELQEQFNLMVASGDLPDIIYDGWVGDDLYTGGYDKYIEDGTILRLNELIDEYAPDYKWAIENVVQGDEKKEFYTDGGNMAGFFAISPYEEYSSVGVVFMGHWLEELGLEPPETIQEYEDALLAFKEQKGATCALELPLNGIEKDSGVFLSAWNIGPSFYQVDGEVKYGPIQPEFKEYLELLNRWYEMGLIDKDFPTRDDVALQRLAGEGQIGICLASPDYVLNWVSEMETSKYPVLNKGDEVHYRMKNYQKRPPFGATITTACKNPEAAVKFLNYGYTEEGYMLYNYGVEGVTYELTGNKLNYNGIEYPEIRYTYSENEEMKELVESFGLTYDDFTICTFGRVHINPYLRFEHEGTPGQTNGSNAKEIRRQFTELADTTLNMPLVSLSAEEGETYATIMNQIATYQDTAVLQFIMGTRSLDEFDTYVEDMKGLGIEEVIACEQAAYDRYMAR